MLVRIADLVLVKAGFHFRGTMAHEPDGAYRVVQARDIDSFGRFDPDALMRVRPKSSPEAYTIREGDVLFLSRGLRQVAVPVPGPLEGVIAPNHFFVLRPRTRSVLPEYLGWYLNSPDAQRALRTITQGSNVPYIAKEDLEELPVIVPPLDVQERIVTLAGLWEQEQRLLAELVEERRRLTMEVCARAARAHAH